MKLTFVLLLGLFAAASSQDTGAFFDCNRQNMDCGTSGGTCNAMGTANEGVCDCTAATADPTNDANPCVDDGVADCADIEGTCGVGSACKTIAGADVCFCDDKKWGGACENDRVMVTCDANTMTVSITPYGNNNDGTTTTFAGVIYNALDRTNCMLTADATNVATFSRTYNLDGTANPAGDLCVNQVTQTITTDNPPVTEYTVTLRVEHESGVFLGTDLVIDAKCRYSSVSTLTEAVTSVRAANDDVGRVAGDGDGTPVEMLVRKTDGDTDLIDSTDVAIVGDAIDLKFFMEDNDAFENMMVESCTVHDGVNTGNAITLVDTGCPVYRKGILLSGLTRTTTGTAAPDGTARTGMISAVPIRAFRFTDSSAQLTFECTVKVCGATNTADCDVDFATACTNAGPISASANGRRKREAPTEEFQLSASIRIGPTSQYSNGTVGPLSNDHLFTDSECWQQPRIQVTIAALSVLALLFLILCAIITACLISRRRNKKEDSMFDQSSVSSTQHLAIPRPKV